MQGPQIQSLTGELRFRMLHGTAKRIIIIKQKAADVFKSLPCTRHRQNLPFTSSFFFLPSTTQLHCPHPTGDKTAARGGGVSCRVTAGGGSEIRARSSVLQLDLCLLSVVHMLKTVSPCPAGSSLLCPVASKPHWPGLWVASLSLETKGLMDRNLVVQS